MRRAVPRSLNGSSQEHPETAGGLPLFSHVIYPIIDGFAVVAYLGIGHPCVLWHCDNITLFYYFILFDDMHCAVLLHFIL